MLPNTSQLVYENAGPNTISHACNYPGIEVGVPFLLTVTGDLSANTMYFYKDGELATSITSANVAPTHDSTIGMILGQEMDSSGGTFDGAQS